MTRHLRARGAVTIRDMRARWSILFIGAVVLGACVPTPIGRATPAGGSGAAPSATPTSPATALVSPTTAGSTARPSFIRPTPKPSPTFLVYAVRAGDSLGSIARLFGTTARSIAYWNRTQYPSLDPDSTDYEPDRIEVGWTLLLIPTEVVDEDELLDPTPVPSPVSPEPSAGPS